MAFKALSRVAEFSTSTATSDFTLAGAITDYRTFSSAGYITGDTAPYFAELNAEWEEGIGTINGGVLQRTIILDSSNSGAKVSFSSGSKRIFVGLPPKLVTIGATKGHLVGLTLSNNVTDATNDIDIAPGEAATDGQSHPFLMTLLASITKRSDASWAVGSGNGGLDDGSSLDGTLCHYLIQRADTGVVDVLQSYSPDRAATITMTIATPGVVTWADHGLQAGSRIVFTTTGALPTGVTAGTVYYVIATGLTTGTFRFSATQGGSAVNTTGSQSGVHTGTSAPLMPTNYDRRRYIGSVLRVSSAIVPFVQVGDDFIRSTIFEAQDVANLSTSAIMYTVGVPIGRKVIADFRAGTNTASRSLLITSPDMADQSPNSSITTSPAFDINESDARIARFRLRTNASGEVRAKSTGGSTALIINSFGWTDRRGRDG